MLARLDGYSGIAKMIAQPPAYGITESSQHFGYFGHELRVSRIDLETASMLQRLAFILMPPRSRYGWSWTGDYHSKANW